MPSNASTSDVARGGLAANFWGESKETIPLSTVPTLPTAEEESS